MLDIHSFILYIQGKKKKKKLKQYVLRFRKIYIKGMRSILAHNLLWLWFHLIVLRERDARGPEPTFFVLSFAAEESARVRLIGIFRAHVAFARCRIQPEQKYIYKGRRRKYQKHAKQRKKRTKKGHPRS